MIRCLPWIFALVPLFCISSAQAQTCSSYTGNPLVRFETSLGDFYVVLCSSDSSVATTVDNFLDYVDSGAYTTTGFVHRALTPAESGSFGIIQGGGYYIDGSAVATVATNPPIPLQAGLSNLRGTIAMARTSLPDSATSQWFINTEDNVVFDPGPGQDGYAVFGEVLGTGMDVVDAIVDQQKWNINSVYFPTTPLIDYPGDGSSVLPYFVYVTDVVDVPEPTLLMQLVPGTFALLGLGHLRRRERKSREDVDA